MRSRGSGRWNVDPLEAVGLAVLAGGLVVWVLMFTNFFAGLFAPSTRAVRADFANAEDIVPNDPVRIQGVQVGTVAGVALAPPGRGAIVTMDIDTSAGPIYRNASASILWRTILGANDAIALNPGTSAAGPLASDAIPLSNTTSQVELDEITRVLHEGARSGMQTMLQQLGPAFADHDAPKAAFTTLAAVAPTLARGVGALRGVEPDTDLRNLVIQASRAAQALDVGSRAADTQQFVHSAATTLTAVGDERSSVAAILANARVALPDVTETAPRIDRTLSLVNRLVSKLMPVAPAVAPTLVQLHPVLDDLNSLLGDATPLWHSLRPAVNSLADTARVGVPVIDELSPALRQVDTQILPALTRIDPETKHTTYEMIGPTFSGLDGLASGYNSNSHVARLDVGVNANVVGGDLLPCTVDFTGSQLLVCQSLVSVLEDYLAPSNSAAAGVSPSEPALQTLGRAASALGSQRLGDHR